MRYENMIWDYHYTKRKKKKVFSSLPKKITYDHNRLFLLTIKEILNKNNFYIHCIMELSSHTNICVFSLFNIF